MFELTDLAATNLKDYLAENKIDSPIRVYLASSCSGAALTLTLDEPGENDRVFEDKGLKFVIAEDLLAQCGSVKIDFLEADGQSGFAVSSANPVETTGGCGCCCGSCGSDR